MIKKIFHSEGITEYALLPFSACRVTNERLFSRLFSERAPKFVLVFLMPYYLGDIRTNLSRYAVARDYHLYVQFLDEALKQDATVLKVCADHSPVDERELALKAGLGVRGKNGLLLNETYGSYVFIGEVFLSEMPMGFAVSEPQDIVKCKACGACLAACPTGALCGCGECLSDVSQQKNISQSQAEKLVENNILWGCDICQAVCPYNRDLPDTPILFFKENLIGLLTEEKLKELFETGEFSHRAYAWRGKMPILRNLENLKKGDKDF